ncbi:NACHT domain-containing protein [Nocardia speluncae]|uniref:NACHT domain-containing protein n=1 Tax=Nocardia speluncae TaxID=419477 RepID=A0A846XQ38_9NOCA|nr:NACHT domain-containing protein [Nocardia speluncae]NKY36816.1 NACHT domain-containing protein [Nocardia speluncae]
MRVSFTTTSPSQPDEMIESADVSDITAYYELLDRPLPRLVVLGEPGSGKTVAAIHLVLGLLDTRRGLADAVRAEHPVPVRVNASGWDGTQDFSGWLTTRLGYDYPQLRPVLARKLVEDRMILPIIDGLDEMDTPDGQGARARALLDQLNTAWRNEPVVVVCRTTEFQELADLRADNGLHGAETVTLQPLSIDRIDSYLTSYRKGIGPASEDWSEVTAHIVSEPDGALATALHSPWMLSLAINALHPAPGITPAPGIADRLTSCTTVDAVEDLLFAAQIPAAVGLKQKKQYRKYTRDNVHVWMQSLAHFLEDRRNTGRDGTSVRLDEIWEVAGSTRCRILHGLTVGIIVAITFGFGIAAYYVGLLRVLIIGVVVGAMIGLVVGGRAGLIEPTAKRMVWRATEKSRWRKALSVGLVVWLVVAGGLELGIELAGESEIDSARHPLAYLVAGGLFGVAFGAMFGAMFGVVESTRVVRRAPGRSRWRRRLVVGVLLGWTIVSHTVGVILGGSVDSSWWDQLAANVVLVVVAVGLVEPTTKRVAVWRAPQLSGWRRGLIIVLAPVVVLVVAVVAVLWGIFIFMALLVPMLEFQVVMSRSDRIGVVAMFAVVAVLVVAVGVDAKDQLRSVVDERRLIRGDIQVAVLAGVMACLASGLIIASVHIFMFTVDRGLFMRELLLAFGLVLTVVFASGRATGRFLTATLIFRCTKAFPNRPTVFLDWARRNGLLRVNGTAYQFRHETYRQWLLQQPSLE